MRRLRWLPWVLAGLLAAGLRPERAAAGPSPYHTGWNKGGTSYSATITVSRQGISIDVRATRSSSGATIAPISAIGSSVSAGSSSGDGGPPAETASASTPTRSWCDPIRGCFSQTGTGPIYQLQPVNVATASAAAQGWITKGEQQHPGSRPEAVYVNGSFQGIVWVPQGGQPGTAQLVTPATGSSAQVASAPIIVDPRAVALDVLQQIGLPTLHIRVNPDLGLVAMPGWFWVEGYDGQPFGGSATVGPYSVGVQIQPTSYTWGFGDGTTFASHSLGKPYPAESDVQHTYQYSSLHHPDGFPVRLTVQFAATYSVNGGPADPLSSMERTYTAGYRVQELQSILTSH